MMASEREVSGPADFRLLEELIAREPEAKRTLAALRPLARSGVQTADQYTACLSAVMSDLGEGKLSPQVGNTVSRAVGKVLKHFRLGSAAPKLRE